MNATVLLFAQIILGWMFGLIYAKTCGIQPCFLAHLMTDGRLGFKYCIFRHFELKARRRRI